MQVASIPGCARSKLHLLLGAPKVSCIYSWERQKQVASISGGAKSKLHLFLGAALSFWRPIHGDSGAALSSWRPNRNRHIQW